MVVIVTIVKHTRNRCRHSRKQVVVIVVAALQRCCCTTSQRGLDSFLLLFTVICVPRVYVLLFIKCVVFIANICDEWFVLLSSSSNTVACTVEHHNTRWSSNDMKSGEMWCNVILFRLPCYCAFSRMNITWHSICVEYDIFFLFLIHTHMYSITFWLHLGDCVS